MNRQAFILSFFFSLLLALIPVQVLASSNGCSGGPDNLGCNSSATVTSGFTPSSVTTPRVSIRLPSNLTSFTYNGTGSAVFANYGGYGNATGITTRVYLDNSLVLTKNTPYTILVPLAGFGTRINASPNQTLSVEFTITGATANVSQGSTLVAAVANFSYATGSTVSPSPIPPVSVPPKIPTIPPITIPPPSPPVVPPL